MDPPSALRQLQGANLMVNCDLPWNPNRLEQRFGRIDRIGQEEVCHIWNLVAHKTREGERSGGARALGAVGAGAAQGQRA